MDSASLAGHKNLQCPYNRRRELVAKSEPSPRDKGKDQKNVKSALQSCNSLGVRRTKSNFGPRTRCRRPPKREARTNSRGPNGRRISHTGSRLATTRARSGLLSVVVGLATW